MKYYNNLLILLVFLIVSHSSKSENPCGIMTPHDTTDWGIGITWLPLDADYEVVKLNDNAYHKYIHRTRLEQYFVTSANRNDGIPVKSTDLVWLGSFSTLKVYGIKDTLYNILNQTIDGGVWISIHQLNSRGAGFYTYRSLVLNQVSCLNKKFENIYSYDKGVNLPNRCLNLRNNPSLESDIITCVYSNSPEREYITKIDIKRTNGNWAYVRVMICQYDEENDESGEGCAFKVVEGYDGWIKAIDDSGFPNIWFAVSL